MNKFILILKKIGLLYIPITFLVIFLSIIFSIDLKEVIKFLLSSILIMIGVSLYLVGYDLSYPKISDKVSFTLLKKKNISYLLLICFLISFFTIILEPEILKVSLPNIFLLFLLAFSISLFFLLSIYRILSKTNYKYYLIISYLLVFLLMLITDIKIIPFALERSALSMGLVSAPFLITMGMSLSKRSKIKNKDHTSFGILGLCSIGPMIVFLIFGMFFKLDLNSFKEISLLFNLFVIFLSLVLIFIIYLIFIRFKISRNKKNIKEVSLGFLLVFIGISLFLMGARTYSDISFLIGSVIKDYSKFFIILIIFLFSFFIIRVEPSFNFLMSYVEDVTSGGIKNKFLELFLSLGASIALVISVFISIYNLDIMMFLIPSFFLALILAFLTPNNFLGIAFDSLGAVIGTISSTFFIPFLLGLNSSINTIGYLAFIGIVPVIFLEIAGFIYEKEVVLHDFESLDDRIVDYD